MNEFLESEARWLEAHAAVIQAAVAHDGMPSILQTALAGVVYNLEQQAARLRTADDGAFETPSELAGVSDFRQDAAEVKPGETVVSSSALEDQISLVRHCQHAVSSLTDIEAMEEVHKGALYLLEHQLRQIVESLYVVGWGPGKGAPQEDA